MMEELVYKAKLAEQLEMYKEMKEIMKSLVEKKGKGATLSEDERNLLSVAYKNVVGQRRSAWRLVCSLEAKTEDEWKRDICVELREKVEEELHELCNEIIELLKSFLLPQEDKKEIFEGDDGDLKVEAAVFFYKMKGDYFRYLVEVSKGDEREKKSEEAKSAYQYAEEVAEKLAPTHPIRLGLALNFSVYHYEIACDPQAACGLAKKAFDAAIAKLDSACEDTYKDSTLILQLLRDNLSLWTSENEDQEEK